MVLQDVGLLKRKGGPVSKSGCDAGLTIGLHGSEGALNPSSHLLPVTPNFHGSLYKLQGMLIQEPILVQIRQQRRSQASARRTAGFGVGNGEVLNPFAHRSRNGWFKLHGRSIQAEIISIHSNLKGRLSGSRLYMCYPGKLRRTPPLHNACLAYRRCLDFSMFLSLVQDPNCAAIWTSHERK